MDSKKTHQLVMKINIGRRIRQWIRYAPGLCRASSWLWTSSPALWCRSPRCPARSLWDSTRLAGSSGVRRRRRRRTWPNGRAPNPSFSSIPAAVAWWDLSAAFLRSLWPHGNPCKSRKVRTLAGRPPARSPHRNTPSRMERVNIITFPFPLVQVDYSHEWKLH